MATTTIITSLKEAQSLAAKKTKDGSYVLDVHAGSHLHHNPKHIPLVLNLISPKAWRKMGLYFANSTQELCHFLKNLQTYPNLAEICIRLSDGTRSINTLPLSKWLMRTGRFEMLQTFSVNDFEWSMRSLQCFCKGLEMIRSLKEIHLNRNQVPKHGAFCVKEALIKREPPLDEFICGLWCAWGVAKKNFFMFAKMIEYRKVVRQLSLPGLLQEEDLRFLHTAAARSPEMFNSAGVRTKLIVKVNPSIKSSEANRKFHLVDPNAQALVRAPLLAQKVRARGTGSSALEHLARKLKNKRI